ncbi:MAG: hypothetical protein H7Y43_11785, partial [Akkermansiaceae bacterium]|nr:hypothetical protein [Verrucomicrobiales bacterium]
MSPGFPKLLAAWLLLMGMGVEAQDQVPGVPAAASVRTIPTRALKSPVENFRRLLAMTVEERTGAMAIYPPLAREKLLTKLQEYQLLPEPLRELRLQSTELRWYLLPLLKMSDVAARTERVKSIPDPYQKLVATRLEEWDIWPPTLKQEVLDYESTMHYLVGRNAEVQPQLGVENLSAAERADLDRKAERWGKMPDGQR